ncbi:protein kinase domain-containing protein [Pseudonocardia lacus]|uniref:protein kinase domain-containing protein n=1 Tax=Pseudonocardia lacus TaxID=2835865 RepID=UPI001BDD1CB1|nr:protein kinase [Pseudonocardia lacus]
MRGDTGPGYEDAPTAPVRGEMFGPYRLEGLIGQGGMGEVHRAFDVERTRLVALKRMPRHLGSDPEFRARFSVEAQIAARMRNPHVIPIHDYGQIDGQPFIDMRLVDGVDLKSRLEVEGALRPEQAVAIVAQIASALDAAHAEGLVHRDVKPSNVLTADGDFVYLIDFGLARDMAAARVTRTGVAVGTLAYMAPERFAGPGDHRVDVYALACILHESLTGSAPFPVEDFLAIMGAHVTAPPPKPSAFRTDVSAAMDAVVARGMHKDPGQRYERAGDLAAAAKAALADAVANPRPTHASGPTVSGPVRRVPAHSGPVGGGPVGYRPTDSDPLGRPRTPTGTVRGAMPPLPPMLVPMPHVPAPRRRSLLRPSVLITAAGVVIALLLGTYAAVLDGDEPVDGATVGESGVAFDSEGGGGEEVLPASVSTTIAIGESPRNLAITADSSLLYATNRDDDSISVIDTATDAVVRTVQLLGGNGPEGIALTPDGSTSFVVDHLSSSVAVIDNERGEVERYIPVDTGPTDVVVDDQGFAYVTTLDGSSVLKLDTEEVLGAVTAEGRPQSLAVSPDGSLGLITKGESGSLVVMDLSDFSIFDEIRVGTGPDGVAVSDDLETAYVVNIGDNTVSVVDLILGEVVSTIPVGERPISVALHPDGRTAYVTNNSSGTLSVIDTAANRVTETVPVGLAPEAVAVAPDGLRAYVVNAGDGSVSVVDTARG